MDRLDQEIINNIINTETMKNGSTNKSAYSGSSSSRGCSSPTLAVVIVVLAILGWIYAIGSACVSSCNSKSESSYSYTPKRSYSSYSSRSYSSDNTYSSKSNSSSYSSRTYSRKSTSSKKSDDPYHAKDYYDAEDFYEDNYDDFWDYEDAEDYYNEHSDD